MIGPKLLASVALFLTAASSFKLPAGLEDGFYRVYLDSNGNEIHEPANTTVLTPLSKPVPRIPKASARTPIDAPRSGSLAPRFGQGVLQSWCGCGFNMNPGDCDAAVADIKNQVNIPGQDGVLIPWGMSYYSIRGSVVAFACDDDMSQAGPYGALPGGVDVDYFTEAYSFITSKCGLYIAGTMLYLPWGPPNNFISPIVGYMRYSPGTDFCGDATGSRSSSC